MAKVTQESEKTSTVQTMKKVSATNIKLADKPAGFELEGKYIGTTEREHTDGEGEIKKMFTMVIEDKKGNRIKFLADAGLRMALEDSLVNPGDWFKAIKGEKENIGKGRTMNQWDIYQNA